MGQIAANADLPKETLKGKKKRENFFHVLLKKK